MNYNERTELLQEVLERIGEVDQTFYNKIIENELETIKYFSKASDEVFKKIELYSGMLSSFIARNPIRGKDDRRLISSLNALLNAIKEQRLNETFDEPEENITDKINSLKTSASSGMDSLMAKVSNKVKEKGESIVEELDATMDENNTSNKNNEIPQEEIIKDSTIEDDLMEDVPDIELDQDYEIPIDKLSEKIVSISKVEEENLSLEQEVPKKVEKLETIEIETPIGKKEVKNNYYNNLVLEKQNDNEFDIIFETKSKIEKEDKIEIEFNFDEKVEEEEVILEDIFDSKIEEDKSQEDDMVFNQNDFDDAFNEEEVSIDFGEACDNVNEDFLYEIYGSDDISDSYNEEEDEEFEEKVMKEDEKELLLEESAPLENIENENESFKEKEGDLKLLQSNNSEAKEEDFSDNDIANEEIKVINNISKEIVEEEVELDFNDYEEETASLDTTIERESSFDDNSDLNKDEIVFEVGSGYVPVEDEIVPEIDNNNPIELEDSPLRNIIMGNEEITDSERIFHLESIIKDLSNRIQKLESNNSFIPIDDKIKYNDKYSFKVDRESINIYFEESNIKGFSNYFVKIDSKMGAMPLNRVIELENNDIWFIGGKNGEKDISKVFKYSDNEELFKELMFQYISNL